jgi:hypothetical protein
LLPVAFIHANRGPNDALGLADPTIADCPNYATALAVSALCRARDKDGDAQIQKTVAFLSTQPFTEQNGGVRKTGVRRTPPDMGYVDLSMPRYIIEAAWAAGEPLSDPLYAGARVFMERCQNSDPQHRVR